MSEILPQKRLVLYSVIVTPSNFHNFTRVFLQAKLAIVVKNSFGNVSTDWDCSDQFRHVVLGQSFPSAEQPRLCFLLSVVREAYTSRYSGGAIEGFPRASRQHIAVM